MRIFFFPVRSRSSSPCTTETEKASIARPTPNNMLFRKNRNDQFIVCCPLPALAGSQRHGGNDECTCPVPTRCICARSELHDSSCAALHAANTAEPSAAEVTLALQATAYFRSVPYSSLPAAGDCQSHAAVWKEHPLPSADCVRQPRF